MSAILRATGLAAAALAAALVAACGPQATTASQSTPTPGVTASSATSPAASPSENSAGRIDPPDLMAAEVTVPAWSGPSKEIAKQCTSGRLKLTPDSPDMFVTHFISAIYANLDDDPDLETAALLSCHYAEPSESMVVAFDRDKSGKIVTLGKVVEGFLWAMKPLDGPGIAVDISDTVACCSMSKDNEFHQWRDYGWSGSAFRQTGGPSTWDGKPYVTDLALTGSPITLGAAKNGRRTATVTVKVRNAGKVTSARFDVTVDSDQVQSSSPYLDLNGGEYCSAKCHDPIAAGVTATLTFTISVPETFTATTLKFYVHAQAVNDHGAIEDPKFSNNWTTLAVRH
jgi:hypothetical protein